MYDYIFFNWFKLFSKIVQCFYLFKIIICSLIIPYIVNITGLLTFQLLTTYYQQPNIYYHLPHPPSPTTTINHLSSTTQYQSPTSTHNHHQQPTTSTTTHNQPQPPSTTHHQPPISTTQGDPGLVGPIGLFGDDGDKVQFRFVVFYYIILTLTIII